jgi:hypothetical protein
MSTSSNAEIQNPPISAVDEDDRFEQELLANGVLDQLSATLTDGLVDRQWQPIPWHSKPISETILEERR